MNLFRRASMTSEPLVCSNRQICDAVRFCTPPVRPPSAYLRSRCDRESCLDRALRPEHLSQIEPKLRRCAERFAEPKRSIGGNAGLFAGDPLDSGSRQTADPGKRTRRHLQRNQELLPQNLTRFSAIVASSSSDSRRSRALLTKGDLRARFPVALDVVRPRSPTCAFPQSRTSVASTKEVLSVW